MDRLSQLFSTAKAATSKIGVVCAAIPTATGITAQWAGFASISVSISLLRGTIEASERMMKLLITGRRISDLNLGYQAPLTKWTEDRTVVFTSVVFFIGRLF